MQFFVWQRRCSSSTPDDEIVPKWTYRQQLVLQGYKDPGPALLHGSSAGRTLQTAHRYNPKVDKQFHHDDFHCQISQT